MVDVELLEAIGKLMDEKLKPIQERLDAIEEGQEEIRDSVNVLVEWADKVSRTDEFPLPDVLGA